MLVVYCCGMMAVAHYTIARTEDHLRTERRANSLIFGYEFMSLNMEPKWMVNHQFGV